MTTDISGKLSLIPFNSLLLSLHKYKLTGILHIENPTESPKYDKIYFLEGKPIYAYFAKITYPLGRILIEMGEITEEQNLKSIQMMKESGRLAGEILIEMGVVSESVLEAALEYQIKKKLLRFFEYGQGKFYFETGAPNYEIKHLFDLKVNIYEVIYIGIKEIIPFARIEKDLKTFIDSSIKVSNHFYAPVNFDCEDQDIINQIQSFTQVDQLVLGPDHSREAVYRFVYFLHFTENLYVSQPSEAPAQTRRRDKPALDLPAPLANPAEQSAQDNSDEVASPRDLEKEEAPGAEVVSPEIPPPGIDEKAEIDLFDDGSQELFSADEDKQPKLAAPPARFPEELPPEKGQGAELSVEQRILNKFQSLKEADYFEILEVDRNSSRDEVKKSYLRLVRLYHPDMIKDAIGSEGKGQLNIIFAKISEAYEAIYDFEKRLKYVAYLDSLLKENADEKKIKGIIDSEVAFRKGEVLFKSGDHQGAQKYLELAIKYNSEEPDYLAFYGWNLYRLKGKGFFDEAEKLIGKAIKLEVHNVSANFYYGLLYKEIGNYEIAVKYLENVLKVNPNHADTLKEFKLIQSMRGPTDGDKRDDKKKKGLFGKIFGKSEK